MFPSATTAITNNTMTAIVNKKNMITKDHRGPWISRLLLRGGVAERAAYAQEHAGDLTVPTDGAELLEDFPSRRISSCEYVQRATTTGLLEDFPSSPRELSQKRHHADAAILSMRCQKKRVRFVEKKSTVHYYYKPNNVKYQQTLYLSRSDREQCRKETLLTARRINSFLRHHEARFMDLPSLEADAAFEPHRMIKRSSQDKIEEIISCMLPDPTRLPASFEAEEIIGIDHLISSKKVVFILMQLRTSHTKAVLEHCRGFEGFCNQEELAQVSQKLSEISSTIARRRATYVTNLK